ncbi:MAG: YafY family protein [Lachnospiraceae bacterium]|nr:YafY family protein [Lachnospiraceae bacterium]
MQMNRLFEIIYLLLDKKSVTARELAEHFEVSTRTIYRDVDTLSAAGVPIYMNKGKGGGIALLPEYVLNKAVLTEKEKADILSSLQALRVISPMETTTLQKCNSLFGAAADWIEVDFTGWANPQGEKELFQRMKEAILHHTLVEFTYANGKGEASERKVEPLKLVYKGNSWYLHGYCRTREDFRFFKLHRMREVQVTEEHFLRKVPEQIWTEDPVFQMANVTLRLKLSAKMGYRVYDEFQEYEQLADGSFQVELQYPEGEWLYQYVNSFGDQCEVLSPDWVRDGVQARLRRTLDIYQKNPL